MSEPQNTRLLVIEDDEEDFILTRDLLREIRLPHGGSRFTIEWARTFAEGLRAMTANSQEVALVDFRLGAHDGIELLQAARAAGAEAPVIMLTGAGHEDADHKAMKAGAADYLVKGEVEAPQLERTIRYAIERKRAASLAAFEQARLAAFGAQVGLVLTQRGPLTVILEKCASAMVQYLSGGLAQLWVYNQSKEIFELRAGAGTVNSQADADTTMLEFKSLWEGKPVFISDVGKDSTLQRRAWIRGEGFTSFAAYPMMLEDRLVGCMALFSREPLAETVLQELASVANGIALSIQRKQAEDALDASESRYQSVVSSIKEVVFQISESGQWAFLNSAWTKITGFAAPDTLDTIFLDYFSSDTRELVSAQLHKLWQGETDHCDLEAKVATQLGDFRWVELSLSMTCDSADGVRSVSGSLNDITDRKRAEAEVQKLAAFPRVNPNPVLEFTRRGELSYANDAAAELVKLLGKKHILETMPASVRAIVAGCLECGTKRLREQITINGRTLSWSFFPVEGNQVVHCYGADITEILNLEAQYRHAQKLESVGQMAAGIAHDYNNVLTVIQGYADCLLGNVKGNETLTGPLKQIAGAARRAATLTRKLLTFSRKQVIQARPLNINAVLIDFGQMLPRLLGEDITLKTDYAEKIPAIEADEGMVEQVMMNLAVNARDAMPRGGRLVVTTSLVDVDENYVSRRTDARVGQFVVLSVEDTGCGMDTQILTRIFEPFFSTKEVGRGTGLGLATVYGIVKQHQGWVEVTSAVGVGTTFRVFFPALPTATVETDDQGDSLMMACGGRETILLVEDEPVLRELVAKVLQEYDYRVLEAETGVQALKVWDEHQGKVDLLLTDMVMPGGVSGAELAQRLRQRKPDLRVIYSSGYSSEIVGKNFSDNDPVFLAKPYRPPQLAQRVRKCLDSPPQPILEVITN
jgi:two-component system, cell cycle sensor histidine kinase and response regulator CckA